MTGTWSIYMVWADGNPVEIQDGLYPREALENLRFLRERHPRTPPAIFAVDAMNPERNWDADQIEELIFERNWPEYAAGAEADERGPDLTPADYDYRR